MNNTVVLTVFRNKENINYVRDRDITIAGSSDIWKENHQESLESDLVSLFLVFAFVAITSVLVALFSNGLAFLVFFKKPVFRKILSNRLVLNLMTINIVSCLTLFPAIMLDLSLTADSKSTLSAVFPPSSPPTILPRKSQEVPIVNNGTIDNVETTTQQQISPFSSLSPMGVCIWSTVMSSVVAHASLFAMMSIGVDQYLAVLDPLEYNAKVTRGVSRKLISSVWILGFSAAAIASSQLIWASDYSPWISCREAAALSVRGNNNKDTTTTGFVVDNGESEVSLEFGLLQGRIWLAVISIAFFAAPVLILTCIYIRIFVAASKNSRDIRRNSFHHQPLTMASSMTSKLADEDLDEIINQENQVQDQVKNCFPLQHNNQNAPNGIIASNQNENVGINPTRSAPDLLSHTSEPKGSSKSKGENRLLSSEISAETVTAPSNGQKISKNGGGGALMISRKAPKLSALRGQTTFSKTISSPGVGNTNNDRGSNDRPAIARQMSHQDHRRQVTVMSTTPKRKCSFSSVSEFRYLADGGKTSRTFLFPLEAPSPATTPTDPYNTTSATVNNQTQHCDTPPSAASQRRAKYRRDSTSIEWSSRETDHSSILTGFGGSSTNTNSPNLGSYGQPVGCPSPALRKNGSIEITSNPMFVVGALADPTMENVSRNSSPSLNNHCAVGTSMRTRHESIGEEGTTKEASSERLHKAGSLISMTSQAARKLSVNVTRRASSVYQFFQYKEELRTAKISLLVLVIAVLCWGPFFLNLALLASIFRETNKSSSSTNEDAEEGLEGHLVEIKGHTGTVGQSCTQKTVIYWTHFVSNLLMLCFAAISPFLYVFRSTKVQNCIGQVLKDTFCCFSHTASTTTTTTRPNYSFWPPSRTGSRSTSTIKSASNNLHTPTRRRSSCILNEGGRENHLLHQGDGLGFGGGKGCRPQMEVIRGKLERNKSSSCPNIAEEISDDADQDENNIINKNNNNPLSNDLVNNGNNSENHPFLNDDVSFNHHQPPTVCNIFPHPAVNEICDKAPTVTIINNYNHPYTDTVPYMIKPSPILVYTTSSNMDVYNTVIYEEEEGLMPPDDDSLSHRRLSTSLPYGLNLIGGDPKSFNLFGEDHSGSFNLIGEGGDPNRLLDHSLQLLPSPLESTV